MLSENRPRYLFQANYCLRAGTQMVVSGHGPPTPRFGREEPGAADRQRNRCQPTTPVWRPFLASRLPLLVFAIAKPASHSQQKPWCAVLKLRPSCVERAVRGNAWNLARVPVFSVQQSGLETGRPGFCVTGGWDWNGKAYSNRICCGVSFSQRLCGDACMQDMAEAGCIVPSIASRGCAGSGGALCVTRTGNAPKV